MIYTDAELLIDLADEVLHPHDELLVFDSEEDGVDLPPCTTETIALALRLRSNPGMCLRAIMERWTRFQIVRELY